MTEWLKPDHNPLCLCRQTWSLMQAHPTSHMGSQHGIWAFEFRVGFFPTYRKWASNGQNLLCAGSRKGSIASFIVFFPFFPQQEQDKIKKQTSKRWAPMNCSNRFHSDAQRSRTNQDEISPHHFFFWKCKTFRKKNKNVLLISYLVLQTCPNAWRLTRPFCPQVNTLEGPMCGWDAYVWPHCDTYVWPVTTDFSPCCLFLLHHPFSPIPASSFKFSYQENLWQHSPLV